MTYTFLITALCIAIVDWIAVLKTWKRVIYFAKPATMVALIIWFWQATSFHGASMWFAVGLILSLIGDVLLMLPHEQFIGGLVSFLLAHIAYLIGFNTSLPPINLAVPIVLLLVGITAWQIYRRIASGLVASNKQGLTIPVLAYSTVISLMLVSALLTLIRAEWQTAPALVVSAGALLFYLSDTFLAWNKFVASQRSMRITSIATYHLGQMLIALGVALHLL